MCFLQLCIPWVERGMGEHPAHQHRVELENLSWKAQAKDCHWLVEQYDLVVCDFPQEVHLLQRKGVGSQSCLRKERSTEYFGC